MSKITVSPSPGLRDRLRALRDALLHGLVERDTPMRLSLLAALAGEHLLLIGLPGTAKSELARRLHRAFRDATYFERLLTRFSVPEELFGPLSIKALESDRYQRLTEGYLPRAAIAFLDEIFKANSAILNALLTLLNEREFDNGTLREKTPLVCVLAASNELPEGDELHALYDRFLLRCEVEPVSAEGFDALIDLRGAAAVTIPDELKLSREDLEAIRGAIDGVAVPADVRDLLKGLRALAAASGFYVSDRRWRKIVRLLQASAFTDGRSEVSIWDGWLLQHCAWEQPEHRREILEWYSKRVGAASALNPEQFARMTQVWEATYQRDATSQSQMRDEQGRLLYVSNDENQTKHSVDPTSRRQRRNAAGEVLYLAPPAVGSDRTKGGVGYTAQELQYLRRSHGHYFGDMQTHMNDPANWHYEEFSAPAAMEPTRFSGEHIEGRANQVDAVRRDVLTHLRGIDARVKSVIDVLDQHLWVSPGFSQVASRELARDRATAVDISKRLERLVAQFRKLPRVRDP